jgi:E1A/CREB-binding protein
MCVFFLHYFYIDCFDIFYLGVIFFYCISLLQSHHRPPSPPAPRRCASCHAKAPGGGHPHALEPQRARAFDETRMRLTDEERASREAQMARTMALLVHASACASGACPSSNCAKVKALFQHAMSCPLKIAGGCAYCRRMWALLQAHAKACAAAECPVPRCRELRALRRGQAARADDARRAAYRAMLRRQEAGEEAGAGAGAAGAGG